MKSKKALFIKMAGVIIALYLLGELVIFLFPVKKEGVLEGYPQSVRIYAGDGRLLREAVNSEGARARWQQDIPEMVEKAFIAAEDERFYSHQGVDLWAILRAGWQNFSAGQEVSGASTITMQLARLLFDHSRSFPGKLAQAFSARRLEAGLTKKDILRHYLNRLPFGGGVIGIGAASYHFFGKPIEHLSLGEGALLAGLPNAPGRNNPLVNPGGAKQRQAYVLGRLKTLKFITPEQYERALKEPLVYYSEKNNLEAMHFTDCILALYPGMGEIHTALDADLNREVEEALRDHIHNFSAGGMTNGAVVIIRNTTGEILSMVGSTDYWEGGAYNGATALRQPGSALKPFTYALAFDSGLTPLSPIPDIETHYTGHDGGIYTPVNYSKKYYGPVLLAEALGRSLNVPAIKVANKVGLDRLLEKLRECGFNSLDENLAHYGLGLTLGNGEVSLLELVRGYSIFAREGLDLSGHRIFSPETAFLITQILGDENLRIRAFGPANPLILGLPMAVKTGTSTNWRDNWIVGYNKEITLGIWTGDFENTPMNQVSGAIGAGPLFNKIVHLLASRKEYPFAPLYTHPPENVEALVVCKISGMSPGVNCSSTATWYVKKETRHRPPCNVHKKVLIDKRNGLLASPLCPDIYKELRLFTFLPPEYAQWQEEAGISIPPTEHSPFCPPGGPVSGALVVINPRPGDILVIEPGYDRETQTLELRGTADPAVSGVQWFVDGKKITSAPWPYKASWKLQPGFHTVFMKAGEKKSDPVDFEVRF